MGKEFQPGFGNCERSMVKKEAKGEKVLSAMEVVAPWEDPEKLLQPFYGKQDRTVGQNA